ncbi:MAG: Bacterial leucyl aminopeptidase [Anaerolineales bacterium]|nr:Bacterial leucyl aminopeptidase [Anaerolineales bacterium]
MSRKRILSPIIGVLAALFVVLWLGLAGSAAAQPPHPSPPRGDHKPHQHIANPSSIQSISLSPLATDTSIAGLVTRVDGDRWHADVETLAQFGAVEGNVWGTRYTTSYGNLQARDWISETLAGLGWTPSFHSFAYLGTRHNVVGERVGYLHPDAVYIVGAHFDSRARTVQTSLALAPGAEDNASGTAALLEIARVLADQTPASTVRLIAFSGEEQGLYGSDAYVSDLKSAGELDDVRGVYNLDMIGFTSDANLDVRLESYSPTNTPWMGDFRDHLASMAAAYTPLEIALDNNPCCSDHKPFLDEEVPAVLMIEAEYWDYFNLYNLGHSVDDLPENVVPAQGAAIIKAVVAALAEKAGIVCMLADVTCDGTVDLADLVDLANHWRLSLGQDGYADRHDLNGDETVNIVDLQLAAQALTVQ